MVRQRIKHELIAKESSRKVTFKKRRVGIRKKINELTTLCGVIGCAIVYSSFNDQPEIWPSLPEATAVLDKFKSLPEDKRDRYMIDQKAFLGRSISKFSKALERERKKNQELEKELTVAKYLAGDRMEDLNSVDDIKELDLLLEKKIKLINHKIETMGPTSNQVI